MHLAFSINKTSRRCDFSFYSSVFLTNQSQMMPWSIIQFLRWVSIDVFWLNQMILIMKFMIISDRSDLLIKFLKTEQKCSFLMISQWKNSWIMSKFICEMSYTDDIIKISEFINDKVEMKHLVRLDSTCWRLLLH